MKGAATLIPPWKSLLCLFVFLALTGMANADNLYVSQDGDDNAGANTCLDCNQPCATVQQAVDQASAGDQILVAGSETPYTGLNTRGGSPQIVYVDKSLSFLGGLDASDWEPGEHASVLDAEEDGRIFYITGSDVAVSIRNFTLTGGNTYGLDGHLTYRDAGAGIYVDQASLTLEDSRIEGSVCVDSEGAAANESFGGGLYVLQSANCLIQNNIFSENDGVDGAAMYFYKSNVNCISNTVTANFCSAAITSRGAVLSLGHNGRQNVFQGNLITENELKGLHLFNDNCLVTDNIIANNAHTGLITESASDYGSYSGPQIIDNHIYGNGSGMHISGAQQALIKNNLIENNVTAGDGAGIYMYGANNIIEGNRIIGNACGNPDNDGCGGGIYINGGAPLIISNVIAGNQADIQGCGIYLTKYALPSIINNTIADNFGGEGSAIYACPYGPDLHIFMINNIISGHEIGVHRGTNLNYTVGPVTMIRTLWYDNNENMNDLPIEDRLPLSGDPMFTEDGTWHVDPNSPAVNSAAPFDENGDPIDYADRVDVDGQPRVMEATPDIGADEVAWSSDFTVSLDYAGASTQVEAGQKAVYSASISNLGPDTPSDAVLEAVFTPAQAVGSISASSLAMADDWTASGNAISGNLYAIPDYLPRDVVITCTVAQDYSGVLSCSGEVFAGDGVVDEYEDNNRDDARDITIIAATPDLYLNKTGPSYVESGEAVAYTLAYGNQGGLPAEDAVLTDTLPVQVSFVSAEGSYGWDAASRTLSWILGDLASGDSGEIAVQCLANAGLTNGLELTNKARISTSSASDPDGNNTASSTATAVTKQAAVEIINFVSAETVEVGDVVDFSITIKNTGPIGLNPTFTQKVPDGLEYVPGSASADQGRCVYDDMINSLYEELDGPLAPGAQLSFSFSLKVTACGGDECGTIDNTFYMDFPDQAYLSKKVGAVLTVQCPDLKVELKGPRNINAIEAPNDWEMEAVVTNVDNGARSGLAKDVILTITEVDEDSELIPQGCDPQPNFVNDPVFEWNLGDIEAGENNKKVVRLRAMGDVAARMAFQAAADSENQECEGGAFNFDMHAAYGYEYGVTLSAELTFNHEAVDVNASAQDKEYKPFYTKAHAIECYYRNPDPQRPPILPPFYIQLQDLSGFSGRPENASSLESHSPRNITYDKVASEWVSDEPLMPDEKIVIYYDERFTNKSWEPENPEHAQKVKAVWVLDEAEEGGIVEPGSGNPESLVVSMTVPLAGPIVYSPMNGEVCPGNLYVEGVIQCNTEAHVYVDSVEEAVVQADDSGYFQALVNLAKPAPASYQISVDACSKIAPYNCVSGTRPITVNYKAAQLWNPQLSSWTGKDIAGQDHTFLFKDQDTGYLSTSNWTIPGAWGFDESHVEIFSCDCNEDPHKLTLVADGVEYVDDEASAFGNTFNVDVGFAHNISLLVTCGEETDGEEQGQVLIDPDGYVVNSTLGWGNVVPGSIATCMWWNENQQAWVAWPAHLYEDQINPQVTGEDGYFAFFTPPGFYYIQVEDPEGWQSWRSQVVRVIAEIVHVNAPYTPMEENESDIVLYVSPEGMHLLDNKGRQDVSAIVIQEGQAVEWVSLPPTDADADETAELRKNPVVRVLSALDPLTNPNGFDSGMMAPGTHYIRRFETAGVYPYSTGAGLAGTITVTALPVSEAEEAALNMDSDGDGVLDNEESGADGLDAGYDGDADGVADKYQATTASLHTINGDYVTLTTSQGEFASAAAAPNPSSQDMPQGVDFSQGFFQYTIVNAPITATVEVSILFPADPGADVYYAYGPSLDQTLPHWQAFDYDDQTGLGGEFSGDELVIHYKDAFTGDHDLSVNGEIRGSGGPGKAGLVQLAVVKTGNGEGAVTDGAGYFDCGLDCRRILTAGEEITLTAAAGEGSTFTGWGGGVCSGTAACTFTLTEKTAVTPNFTQPMYDVSVQQTGNGGGTVKSYPLARIVCPDACSADFTQNTEVALKATPDAASVFVGWSGDCTGEDCTVFIDGAQSLTAEFALLKAGDANGDNTLSLADVIIMLRQTAADPYVYEEIRLADVTGDGKVDFSDALYVLQHLAGLR
ncbi:right-handed parallel beta-helix repeat-containing protein [Desulfatibacillum alkenivorans]|jgi:uncharacterized repeat protein (TIGR01451 family)|nr:right-handed parallel beta-helix repeat-containing protein [Desulfatibacillum alkenivorans]